MQFLSDLFVRCPECEGRRYQPHVLEIRWTEKSIHEVLEMTVTEAIRFFDSLRRGADRRVRCASSKKSGSVTSRSASR